MGCSNGHPHCQIWASKFLPNEPTVKNRTQLSYYSQYGQPMLVAYLQEEMKRKQRLVIENDHWAILVVIFCCCYNHCQFVELLSRSFKVSYLRFHIGLVGRLKLCCCRNGTFCG